MAALQAQKYDPTMRLLETHGAWIVLYDAWAYKIKKPVDLGFFDFSTLEKRAFYCKEELRLNARLTDIYLNVVGIVHANGNWMIVPLDALNGQQPVEVAVQMKRMNPLLQMDNMLQQQQVTSEHVIAVAQQLATFHRECPVAPSPTPAAGLKGAFDDIRSMLPVLEQFPRTLFSEGIIRMLTTGTQLLGRLDKRIAERNRQGWIRDVHGDVHSGNIFLTDPPVIFDCIEFNPEFRAIDVLSEIAFLCMDLERFERSDLSSAFLSAYTASINAIQVPDDEILLHFYKLYKLNIRIKVKTIQAAQHLDDPIQIQQYEADMQPYFSLLNSYIALAEKLCR